MAIWQFAVEFIPRENLINYFGEIPKLIEEEAYWKESFDERVKLPDNYEVFLSSLGEKEKLKWIEESYNWGNYDYGTHITINCQNKNKISVFARFHVGEFDINFANIVLEFAKKCDCVLYTKNRNIIEPEIDLFIKELRSSNSFRFCTDPIGYLQSDEVKNLNWSIRKNLEDGIE